MWKYELLFCGIIIEIYMCWSGSRLSWYDCFITDNCNSVLRSNIFVHFCWKFWQYTARNQIGYSLGNPIPKHVRWPHWDVWSLNLSGREPYKCAISTVKPIMYVETLGNKIVDHSDGVRAWPVGIASKHLHSLLKIWLQWIGKNTTINWHSEHLSFRMRCGLYQQFDGRHPRYNLTCMVR